MVPRSALIVTLAVASCNATTPAAQAPPDAAASNDAGPPTTEVAPPRLIAPVSVSYVTTRRPTFRWKLAAGSDGAFVEVCADRPCSRAITTFTASGDHGGPAGDLPPGPVFWRAHGTAAGAAGGATSATWELVVPAQSAPVAATWGSMLDANGDGLADVVVGDSDGFNPTQHVYVHHGGPLGPSPSPSSILSASAPVERYAESIASAGDVDGDGFGDLIVGSPHEDTVYVYRGGSSGFASPAATLVGPSQSGFGWGVSSAGDVDGDGYADVVVGNPLQAAASGSQVHGGALLYFGAPDGLSPARAVALPPRPGSDAQGLGTFVSTAGDVDADGLADVAVWGGVESTDPQYVLVYLGRDRPWSAPSRLLQFEGSSATWLGNANLLGCAGDIDGDGYPDLVVASCEPASVGFEIDHASIFLGGPDGPPPVPSRRVESPLASSDTFGSSVAALDANQDGLEDLAVAVLSYAHPPVASLVYAGAAGGPGLVATLTTSDSTTLYERELGSPGDVDGDGYPDLVVGFPSRTTALPGAGPGLDGGVQQLHGAVEIHRGGAGGTSPEARWTLLPPDTSAVGYGASLVR
jgi:hypothetical protein